MAYSGAQISSGERSAQAAAYPLFAGANYAENQAVDPRWVIADAITGVGSWASASKNLTTHPTSRVVDRQIGLASKPDISGGSTDKWALLFDLTASAARRIDTIVIAGHNFGSLGAAGPLTVTVRIADTSDFTGGTSKRLVRWTSVSSSKRLVALDLSNTDAGSPAGEYFGFTSVRYIQVTMTSDTVTNFTPEIGEVFFGRRRQMSYPPELPLIEEVWGAHYEDFVADSAAVVRYEYNAGQFKLRPIWTYTGTDGYGLDSLSDTEALIKTDTGFCMAPVWYIPDPSDVDTSLAYYCYFSNPGMGLEFEGPIARMWRPEIFESATFVQDEQT